MGVGVAMHVTPMNTRTRTHMSTIVIHAWSTKQTNKNKPEASSASNKRKTGKKKTNQKQKVTFNRKLSF